MSGSTRGFTLAAPPDAVPLQVVAVEHQSLARAALRRFLRHRLAVIGMVLLTAIVFMALFADVISSKPFFTDVKAVSQPPSALHLLGTDRSGRDVWARVVHGARTSLVVGLGAVAIYVTIGTVLGGLAGLLGGSVDFLIMRAVDTLMSIPTLLLVIVFVAAVGPSLASVVSVIGLLGWPGACRLVRGQILALREAEFVVAARVVGVSTGGILVRHLIPNIVSSLAVLATFGVASAIILEAGLSFLGLGVKVPIPSWGEMINAAQSPTVLIDTPWLWISPGIAIALTVLSVNFIGDGLRDALNPRAVRRG
jgi:peptide/nickel transport system permease protein